MFALPERIPLLIGVLLGVGFVSAAGVSAQGRSGRTIVIRSVPPESFSGTVSTYGITREDVHRIETLVPTIQTLIPIRTVPQEDVSVGDQVLQTTIAGTNNQYAEVKGFKLTQGRFLTEADSVHQNSVAVIDSKHVQRLFPNTDPIGKAIQFNREYFTVVGIVDSETLPSIFIPITTMRSRMGDQLLRRKSGQFELQRYELSEVEILVDNAPKVEQTVKIIEQILLNQHQTKDYEIKVRP
ncbi:ABC transporter permease [Stieleria varia]|uniref:Macrolide export ATP-binding/permease protein MacB n=1 Tax=Stieleria varia TaxID=2528005 RepID=A0A5C6A5A3_9BACT|nr:ABC transporter permease [Stieleria varia]TWT94557.1 Macrolide export ATP-binding/permease protein MacB [Stieleria varia]